MPSLNHPLKWKRPFIVFQLILVGLAVLGGIAWSPTPSQRQINFQQGQHKTQALAVVSTTSSGDRVKVVLKNVSNRNINGIQLSVNSDMCQVEFLDADEPDHQALLPGATYQQWFALPPTGNAVEVSVLAVMFEDKTGDGDPALLKQIKDTRRGARAELMRFKPLLLSALNSPDADSLSAVNRLKSDAEALATNGDVTGNVSLGERKARDEIQYELTRLKRMQEKQGGVKIQEALANVSKRFDWKIAKLE